MHTTTKVVRRSAKFKADVAFKAIAGVPRAELAAKAGVSNQELDAWVETFVSGGRDAFTNKRDEATKDAEIARLQQKLGEMFMRLEAQQRPAINGHEPDEEA